MEDLLTFVFHLGDVFIALGQEIMGIANFIANFLLDLVSFVVDLIS